MPILSIEEKAKFEQLCRAIIESKENTQVFLLVFDKVDRSYQGFGCMACITNVLREWIKRCGSEKHQTEETLQ